VIKGLAPQGGNIPAEVKGDESKELREEISRGRAGVKGSENGKIMPWRVTPSRTPQAVLRALWGRPCNQQTSLSGVRRHLSARSRERLKNGSGPCHFQDASPSPHVLPGPAVLLPALCVARLVFRQDRWAG